MRRAFTESSETVKQPVLCYAFVWFSRARTPHTLTGRGKSPFHPLRSRCFVRGVSIYIKIRADLQSKKFHFSGLQFIQLPLVRKKKQQQNIGHPELVPSSISPSLVFFAPSIRRCRIEYLALYAVLALENNCSTDTISYQMVYPNDQNPKNRVLFYLLPYVPKRTRGKSPELRAGAPGAEGIVRMGRLKLTTNFSRFFSVCVRVCVCVCVSEVFVAAWNNSASCFWKSVGIPVFCWCNVSHVLFIFYIKY